MSDADAGFGDAADALVDRVKRILADQDPELQGAVLADMTAIWLAGHRVVGDRAEGDLFRDDVLRLHAKHVRELAAMYLDGVDG